MNLWTYHLIFCVWQELLVLYSSILTPEYVMNQSDEIPDQLRVEGLETLTRSDMTHSGLNGDKFRLDNGEFSWYSKSRSKNVVEDQENREMVRRFFERDENTVFSDRPGSEFMFISFFLQGVRL